MVVHEIALRAALARADDLLTVASSREPLAELIVHAVELAAVRLPGAAVALYTVIPHTDRLLLVGSTGASFPSEVDPPPDWNAQSVIALRGEAGEPVGQLVVEGVGLTQDDLAFVRRLADLLAVASSRTAREEQLIRSERRMVEAQRISQVGSYDFEMATNTNIWSDQLYRLYGREPQSFNASYDVFLSMLHPDDREHVMAVHQRSMATLEPFEMEERVVWPDGQVRTLASWGEVVADTDGRPVRMVGICWDITERRAMEEQLAREALHDRLTGLPNRALLLDRLGQALDSLPRRAGTLGVLFVDIDRFKVINDSLGHDAGDAVLIELAHRLTAAMRPGDTVGRFGGDEFVVLCEGLDHPAEAAHIAEQLQAEVSRPVSLLGSEVVVTVSSGIALTTSAATLPSDLLRDADAAMYRAKQDGGGHSVVFADGMRTEALDRLDTEMDLRRALAEGHLSLHYQPMVDLSRCTTVGVEALLRWQHPTRGLIGPDEFIRIAEETGLVVPLGEWVLEQACRQLSGWQQQRPGFTMAVNLSGLQIAHPEMIDRFADVLQRSHVDCSALTLEITESVLMRDAEGALAVLRELKRLGVSLSVDDFGTGYSSLSYLKRFPVDVLKIDQSFVSGLADDPDDVAIVRAILALAASLGIAVVAEGIETAAQLEVLLALGCTKGQGFLFSRAMPARDLELHLAAEAAQIPSARPAASEHLSVWGPAS